MITALRIAARVLTNLTHGSFFDEYLLVLIASIGAFALGSRAEATVVLILFEIGKIAGDIVLASTYQALPPQALSHGSFQIRLLRLRCGLS